MFLCFVLRDICCFICRYVVWEKISKKNILFRI